MLRAKPSFHEFCKLTRKGNLIPVYAEFVADMETPVSAFLKLQPSEYGFLLESVEEGHSQSRYSFLGVHPRLVIRAQKGRLYTTNMGKAKTQTLKGDPLIALERILKRYRAVALPSLPRFVGGAVGFMSYDCNRFYEKVARRDVKASRFPDLLFMVTDTLVVFDHVSRKIQIIANAYAPKTHSRPKKKRVYQTALSKIQDLHRRLTQVPLAREARSHYKRTSHSVRSNYSKSKFIHDVNKIKRAIRLGECIQTVLSQRFETRVGCPTFDIYRALRVVNPSPYMFYLNCSDFELVGSSPETHVRREEDVLTLKPIAGTRPRGRTEEEDSVQARELLRDPKERAEHVMLVDLGRNDLGRVSKAGSVQTTRFMTIERYSHVMHIVSQVTSKILPKKTLFDVIRATFPAGTVSGAPKVRAMQLIRDMEPCPRGPYAGLVGYLSFSGNFDSCITIRTVVVQDKRAFIQAGAGIVADSVGHGEWMETRNKARGLIRAIQLAEKGLT